MIKIKFVVFFVGALFLALFGGINYYIGLRGWQNMGISIPFINSRFYWILFWCISMSYLLARLFGKYMPSIIGRILELTGAYWLAAMFYLLMIILMIDLARFADRRFKFLPEVFSQNRKLMFIVSMIVIGTMFAIMIYGTWSSRSIMISKYNINIEKAPNTSNQLTIAMISDMHLGNIVDKARLASMVDRINSLKPDVVLIPGDIIDDSTESFTRQNMGDCFEKIKSKYGVFASLGNHDGMLQSASKTVEVLETAGINVLRDEVLLIHNSFYLVGRDDNTVNRGSGKERKELSKILSQVDKNKPIIVMDHQPIVLDEVEKQGVDLQVSGHTHKGQIFPSNMITSRIFEIDYGYLKKGNLNVIVSSGIGTWGPPIRIGSRSEIVEIILNFTKK